MRALAPVALWWIAAAYSGNALLLQPDGKLVAADDGGQLFRFNPDGTLDTSFGDGGRVGPNFGGPEWV